jgi:hypothetical protein
LSGSQRRSMRPLLIIGVPEKILWAGSAAPKRRADRWRAQTF